MTTDALSHPSSDRVVAGCRGAETVLGNLFDRVLLRLVRDSALTFDITSERHQSGGRLAAS
jgi:hypothetical protein